MVKDDKLIECLRCFEPTKKQLLTNQICSKCIIEEREKLPKKPQAGLRAILGACSRWPNTARVIEDTKKEKD